MAEITEMDIDGRVFQS